MADRAKLRTDAGVAGEMVGEMVGEGAPGRTRTRLVKPALVVVTVAYWRGAQATPTLTWLDGGSLAASGAEVAYQVRAMSSSTLIGATACG